MKHRLQIATGPWVLLAAATLIGTSTSAQVAPRRPSGRLIPQAPARVQTIAFCSDRDGDYEIIIMDADGDNEVNLTNHRANDMGRAWRPVAP